MSLIALLELISFNNPYFLHFSFSNLFNAEKGMSPNGNGQSGALVKYTATPGGKLLPSSDPIMRKKIAAADKTKALDFLDSE